MITQDQTEAVFEACDNAVENDYRVDRWSVEALTMDLQICADDVVAGMSTEQVEECVRRWLRSRGRKDV